MSIIASYIASILEKKGSKLRDTDVSIGEFLFDYRGDMVGVYLGDEKITLFASVDIIRSSEDSYGGTD